MADDENDVQDPDQLVIPGLVSSMAPLPAPRRDDRS